MDGYVHLGPGEPPSGDTARPTMHMEQFVTESVTAVAGDTFTIALIIDSSRMTMPGLALPSASLDTLMPRGLAMTMRMDSRGRVTAFQVERPVLAQGRMATLRMMLPGNDSSAGSNVGTNFRFPESPVRVGETWSDTAACPRALRCAGPLVTTYGLQRVEQNGRRHIAVISWTTDMPPMAVDTPMNVTSSPTHVVGEQQFDLDSGWGVGVAMTSTGTIHMPMGDMAMRMQMRETPLASAVASRAGAPPATAPTTPPRILMRRGGTPTPTTLDSMLALFKRFEPGLEFPECRLPDAPPAADWTEFSGPDSGLRIRLPPTWRGGPPDSTFFGDPVTVLVDSDSSRIRISRAVSASGRQTLNSLQSFGRPTEFPHAAPCRVGAGPEGSVWTLYGPLPDAAAGSPPRYDALGELITKAGRAYHVTVRARAAEARDRVVRIVAGAALTSQ